MISSGIKRKVLLAAVLLWVLAAFSPVMWHSINTWDDEFHLTDYQPIRSLSWRNIKDIFHDNVLHTYIPLTELSFALEYRLVKFHPFLYHFNNLLLHLAVSYMVFRLALGLGLAFRAAVLSMMVFGLHPMHVESVAWATERKDVLYAFFYMLALLQYLQYVQSGKKAPYLWSMAWGLLSMLSKSMALSLPLIFWLCDWMKQRALHLKLFWEKIPFGLFIVPLAWITFALNARIPGKNLYEGILTWLWTFVFYFRQFLFPFQLLPIYQVPKPVQITQGPYFFAVVLFLIIAYATMRFRRNRYVVFATAYFFFSIFFLLRFDDVGVNVVADRYIYLPSLGFCLLLGLVIDGGWSCARQKSLATSRAFVVILAVVFGFLTIKTFMQSRIWKDDFTLWSYLLKKNPNSEYAHFGLGQTYFERGDHDRARYHYQETLKINPRHPKANLNVGEMVYQQGNALRAKEYFKTAIESKPDYAEAYNNYGVILMEEGNFRLAEFNMNEALRLEPENPLFHMGLGDIYLAQGFVGRAQDKYFEALSLDPDNVMALSRLGAIAMNSGKLEAAIAYFQKAVNLAPQDRNLRHNLDLAISKKVKKISITGEEWKEDFSHFGVPDRIFKQELKIDR